MGEQKVLLSAIELSRELGIKPDKVKQLASDGRIPIISISAGIKKFILEDVIEALRKETTK